VLFRWAERLADDEYIEQCRSLQEQWLVEALDPPRDERYNELGDYRVAADVPNDDVLTLYDGMRQRGYKATVVFPDGSVDQELFAEMTRWIDRQETPDGRPMQELYLIVQSRAAAVSIHDRAVSIGLKAVYYSDNAGALWDPFPPGLWVAESDLST
jgi:hypothetical protein